MLTDINKMPPDARVWVYQCNRTLTETEIKTVLARTTVFTDSWTAHKQDLQAGFDIRYNRFLILIIDEKQAMASGCSIDSSVHFIQTLEKELGVSFFDRMLFAYRDGDRVEVLPRAAFESAVRTGKISDDTIVFNNLVQTKRELDSAWEVPMKNSWHKQLLTPVKN